MLSINEISETIHGELPFMGSPCLLIRLEGCNLKCSYCDIPKERAVQEYPKEQLIEIIENTGFKNILFTGGEPLLQIESLVSIIHTIELKNPLIQFVVETNGTIDLEPLSITGASIVMDYKLGGLFPSFKKRTVINNIKKLWALDALKFVFWNADTFKEALEFIPYADKQVQVIFSPVFERREELKPYVGKIIELGRSYPNLKFQLQIHKLLGAA